MPASALRDRVKDALLAFAWDEWAQMGVLASPHRESPWAQDPEALLVFTFEVARDDPRLFDEVLDWFAVNSSLVSARRLRAMCVDATDERLVEAALAWVKQRGGGVRTSLGGEVPELQEPLFRGLDAPVREEDPVFLAYGFRRPLVRPSGKSQPPEPTRPINLAFRLRHLLGLSSRAEVVRCLLTLDAPWATAAVVARSAAYAKRNVHDALASLRSADVLTMTAVGPELRYAVDRAHWAAFLDVETLPVQRDWPQLLGALRRILRWLEREDVDEMSAYMRSSRARDLLETVYPDLAYAGIPVRFGTTSEEAWSSLVETIDIALAATTHTQETSSPQGSSHAGRVDRRPVASFEVYGREPGVFGWRMTAANGQVVAESPRSFASRVAALDAARDVRDSAGELHYDLVEEPRDVHRWRATRDGRVLAASGDTFSSRSNAKRAAERVRAIAAQAVLAADNGQAL
jgi:uncharacterized protein YegP (UPF0339 family)